MENGERAGLPEILTRDPAWMRKPFVEKSIRNLPVIFLLIFLFLLYGYFLAHKIDLTTADLGRHIKNGEALFQNASVLTQNFYSYTNLSFPAINHHWGSGFIFYAVWKLFGFLGVHIFFTVLLLVTFLIFLLSAKDRAGWGIAGLVALLAIPLLGERTEIRPEVFSYLFAGLFFLILSSQNQESIYHRKYLLKTDKLIWLLPILEVAWVNLHIYFLLGPLIIGAFLLEAVFQRRADIKKLLFVFVSVLVATFINPFGYHALTGTATLFQNFGYRLAENQSVWFLERLGMASPNYVVFKIALAVLVLSYLLMVVKKRHALSLSHLFVMLGMTILALSAVRNFALFGFFLIPILSHNIKSIIPENIPAGRMTKIAAWFSFAAFTFAVLFSVPRFFPYWRGFGFGLEKGNESAANFLREQKISGPIFNNYDIGGYLIFYDEKVFVDNRPEAYPVAFFQEIYIPMQENDAIWKEKLAKYGFNAIVFAYHDITPWGQKFLVTRIRDPQWAPVFADSKILVFLRRTEENKAVISRFELPKEIFRVSD